MALVNLLLTLPLLAAALPAARSNHALHEKRQSLGRWVQTDRVHPDAIIPLRIGLTQSDLDSGMDRLMDVSHPSSPNYGKYLSAEEINALFKPSDDAIEQVKAWLIGEGIDESEIVHTDNLGWLAVDLPASVVEQLFNTEYYLHEHKEKGLHSVGCDQYSVPAHLSEHIDYIRPGVKLSTPAKDGLKKRDTTGASRGNGPLSMKPDPWGPPPYHGKHHLPEDLRSCGVNITPPCIQALYNIPKEVPAVPGLELGLFEQGSYFDSSDLNKFFKNYAPWVPKDTIPKVNSVDGGEAPIDCHNNGVCGEADIDIDLATSLIFPQKVEVFQVDDSYWAPKEVALDNTFNTFLDAIDGSYCTSTAFGITGDSPGIDPTYPDPHKGGYNKKLQCGVYKPPKVISASYGESEEDFPANYARRSCNEFMKLGLAGTTMVVSSGDYGVAQPAGDPPGSNGCLSNLAEGLNGTIFNPAYPSDCPYVLSVGATMLPRNASVYDAEVTMNVDIAPHFSSGGGFSNFYPAPSYQTKAVDYYLQNHVPDYKYYTANASGKNFGENGGVYARGGRGFPDVAANGAYLSAYVAGGLDDWFGTSLAAPIFASVLTLINEELSRAGKPPVGFVNPVLYENADALNDIVKGNNGNCGTKGFPAVEGWDPATGLGTPDFPKLLEVFMKL